MYKYLFLPVRKTELFGVESSQTKATGVSAGGELPLDRLDLVANAPVTAPQSAQRHFPKKAPAAGRRASGAARAVER